MGNLGSAGDIGGQMGLFIGASLLTILEILDYLCEVGLSPSWGRGKESGHRRRMCTGHFPPLPAPRCSETGSWDTSGTESTPKGILAPFG